jgi:hypothetical protein
MQLPKFPLPRIAHANAVSLCLIEHVMPQRAYARQVMNLIDDGATDDEVLRHIKENYRLVLLTKDETSKINRLNRSQITKDRIGDAGIQLHNHDLE